jgi:hypothetical protein
MRKALRILVVIVGVLALLTLAVPAVAGPPPPPGGGGAPVPSSGPLGLVTLVFLLGSYLIHDE